MKNFQILVVEDGSSQRELICDFLKEEGYRAAGAQNGEKAISMVKDQHFDILLLDYKMPKMNGMQVLESVKAINPEIDVIMMTAYGTIETAVNAMKAGAADYITKPIDLEELLITIERLAERRVLIRENRVLHEELKSRGVKTDQIIFAGPAMQEVINLAGRVAPSDATVLIQGESGTGKELVAGLIHFLSPRSEKPMITVNCAALAESLLESELFGHEKGAFTGAVHQRRGRFEESDGGSLFLDEIGELSQNVQVKLLRFLQTREFQRVGGNKTIGADVRIISATNRNLMKHVLEGHFREDLYYRLNVVAIEMPPLRDRKEDIPLLIDHFIRIFSSRNAKNIRAITSEARDILLKYEYPGNVRELENIIERAVVITRHDVITERDLPFSNSNAAETHRNRLQVMPLKEALESLELDLISKAMEKAGNNQSKAAVMLDISERMLRYKLKKYGLK